MLPVTGTSRCWRQNGLFTRSDVADRFFVSVTNIIYFNKPVRDSWTGSNAVRFTTFGLEHSSFALTKSLCIDNSDSANIYRSFKH